MDWIEEYQLVLFDMDGLLVNTEEIHFEAYRLMLADRGYKLGWNFPEYCCKAHYEAEGLKEAIYGDFPQLQIDVPSWDELYQEKKNHLLKLLQKGAITLMPGVASLLKRLQERGVTTCVVTHSALEQIHLIKQKNPLLDTIPHWITRENYSHPKPNPECYKKAISTLSNPSDRVIGFEDTPRGLKALMGTSAQAVLVSATLYPEIPDFKERGAWHFSSFRKL